MHTVTYFATLGSCRRSSNIVSVFSNTPQMRAAHNTPKINAVQNVTLLTASH